MALYWMSFCDPEKKPGTQFLGACIVDANYSGDRRADSEASMRAAWHHGCNPGGEVQSMKLPDEMAALVPEQFKYVLMSKERCEQFDRLMARTKRGLEADGRDVRERGK